MDEAVPAKRGRRRKPEAARLDQLVPFRVTAAERAIIEGNAARAGLTVSEFNRRAALGLTVRAKPPTETAQLIGELNHIGVNLNQITARMHLTGELSHSLPATLAELRGLLDRIALDGP